MPWVMEEAESANKMVKRVLPSNKNMSLFQLNGFLEYAMYMINCRPIGVSPRSEAVCPIDIFPVWSHCIESDLSIHIYLWA